MSARATLAKALCLAAVFALCGCGFRALLLSDAPDALLADAGAPDALVALDADANADADTNADADAAAFDADLGHANALAAGQSHTCAVVDGAARCWGNNVEGALGSGDTASHVAPTPLARTLGFDALSAGSGDTCAIEHSTNGIWCWGANAAGQLGAGTTATTLVPLRVGLERAAKIVANGYSHVCTILSDQSLWCWGSNVEGQLGRGDAVGSPNATAPIKVGTDHDWIAASGGDGHACAVRAPGSLWCWGRNTSSELGLGNAPGQIRTPTRVDMANDWAQVECGQDATCAIKTDGSLWCWGVNQYGELGSAPAGVLKIPTRVGSDSDWLEVSIDAFATCARKRSGALWCWGRNAEGQLGLGDIVDRTTPAQVGVALDWARVSVGRFHVCAQKNDGIVWCAGENGDGQLGVGDTMRRNTLTQANVPVR